MIKNISKEEYRVLLADNKLIILLRNLASRLWLWQCHMEKNETKKMRGKLWIPIQVILLLCIASFFAGSLFTSRNLNCDNGQKLSQVTQNCDNKRKLVEMNSQHITGEVAKTSEAIQRLDKSIKTLEMEMALARTISQSNNNIEAPNKKKNSRKAFVFIGINTAFSSKKRRNSLRQTWMPTGAALKKLEKEKGIVIRFVIGHSLTAGGVLDRSIDEEEAKYNDFFRLKHVEGYHVLSSKTRLYFSTIVSVWDAEFYVKVDDDVHLNLGMLVNTLARHRSKPRIYIGCMKSGPVLSKKEDKYYEPEFWKFGEEGNKYFRHATGQIYAISNDLATYISTNSPILHRYANEDVSLGAWLFGLEVEHINDRSMCCGTGSDCEWKSKTGNMCVASFDWPCSGICKSVERMKVVHNTCGEGNEAVWNVQL